jgi:lysyl endopeptidase
MRPTWLTFADLHKRITSRLAALRTAALAGGALLLVSGGLHAASPTIVAGEPARVDTIAEAKRIATNVWQSEAAAVAIALPAPTGAESEELFRENAKAMQMRGKRVQVGFFRDAQVLAPEQPTSSQWAWTTLGDGRKAVVLEVSSPGAAALRVGFRAAQWPAGSQLRALGNAVGDALNSHPTMLALGGDHRAGETVWSPALPGDTQRLEWVFPAGMDVSLTLAGVSHMVAHPLTQAVPLPKLDRDIGSAGTCNSNVACIQSPSVALQQAFASVAKMVYTESGRSFRCTGTLLNDTDTATQIPWFITGNHCFENIVADSNGNAIPGQRLKTAEEMGVVARTLNTYWNFQASTCAGNTSPSTQLRAGGSSFVTNNDGMDMLFLRLSEQPPSVAFYAGWISDPVPGGLAVTAIHHPAGDLKKISQGAVAANPYVTLTISTSLRRESYVEAAWTQGVTEPGSSGSGIFNRQTLSGSDGYFFRGTLWGGVSSCSARFEPDYYSRVDRYINQLAAFLTPNSSGGIVPQTGWYWNAAESGRGFFIERRGTKIFMSGYYYADNGRATWFVAEGTQSGNSMTAPMSGVSGGQTLTGPYVAPTNAVTLGTVTLDMTSTTTATLRWPGGTVALSRFPFGGAGSGTPESGWWWNAAESGRGYSIEIQGNTLFMVGFMYDDAGNPIWYLSSGAMSSTTSYQSVWQLAANGQTLTGAYRAPVVLNSNVGGIVINFTSTRTANLTLPNGRVIQLTRYEF